MRPTLLDPPAKEALRKAVRALRPQLLEDLLDAARGEYRLDVALDKAQLPEARRLRRERLEAWIDEQIRAGEAPAATKGGKAPKAPKGGRGKKAGPAATVESAGSAHGKAGADERRRHLMSAVKEAAHTLLNRLVFLRILEHHGQLSPAVVTGGWRSAAYEKEFAHYAPALMKDDTRGFQALLESVFAELSLDLPGVFGPVGLTPLFPVPAKTLRAVVEKLNDPALESAWGDDTTLGWVYQYWNDPEREALDKKIADGGKIEPHEIASKTQMFTERYMVEWLLQNSLGLTWLSICRKNGWTADAEAVLPVLDARRAEFRGKRERGEVALDALMPVEEGLESAWKYYVPQPLPEDAAEHARASIRDVRVLDPACGSGHFLVIAFDLLARMYEEEARHRGVTWTAEEIAESILANNLFGIDIDPRAIQIAAAALWLKARLAAPKAELRKMNLVAPAFRLAALPKDDPALRTLMGALKGLGIPTGQIERLVEGLRGVDYLGTLLRVERLIGEVVEQGELFADVAEKQRALLESRVAEFLDAHAAEADLGLRLEGEQLAAGLRFMEMVKEGTYDAVVGNPPYQGLKKTDKLGYVVTSYPKAKADLFAAFLERGLELARNSGSAAMVTMRGWMFQDQYEEVRKALLSEHCLRALVDLDSGAFEEVSAAQVVLSVACSVFLRRSPPTSAVALRPTPREDRASAGMMERKRAGLLVQVGRFEFRSRDFADISGGPVVYWWPKHFVDRYVGAPKLGEIAAVRQGLATANNTRFLRRPWEVRFSLLHESTRRDGWAPFINGAAGREWVEPLSDVIDWKLGGFALRVWIELYRERSPGQYIKNEAYYFRRGVAFSPIGSNCRARVHRQASIIGHMGSSAFPKPGDEGAVLALMNSSASGEILRSLNPGVHFEVGDVSRLPFFVVKGADRILSVVNNAFSTHESHREPSVEFKSPGPSPWRHAQAWAQLAVDRPEGTPLPPYTPEYDPPAPEAHLSFALGVALGRFGAGGEGILDTPPPEALPAGILFVGPDDVYPDSLSHPAAAPLLAAWDRDRQSIVGPKKLSLRDYLRKDFFAHHKALYENRPIYFPLSSPNRTFVAWTSIHRWADNTLQTLLADHLNPLLRRLDGEIKDANATRHSTDKKTAASAEDHYATLRRLRDELAQFIQDVTQCAERGAPPTDPACPPRAADAPFHMDLDDGVMINSAALWPLLAPQWKDPAKWWKQLCLADKAKDYDWSHLAARYFPARVDAKCQSDPSLAVAHSCFWQYHPAKAYAWELRLQDEIHPDFHIAEPNSDTHRATFLTKNPTEAHALEAAEQRRRERKSQKAEADDASPDDPDDASPDEPDDPASD